MTAAASARGSQGAPSPGFSGFQGMDNITDEMALQAQFEEYLDEIETIDAKMMDSILSEFEEMDAIRTKRDIEVVR